MTGFEISQYNLAVDKCAETALKEGFKHTSGLDQNLANELAELSEKIKGLKKKVGNE